MRALPLAEPCSRGAGCRSSPTKPDVVEARAFPVAPPSTPEASTRAPFRGKITRKRFRIVFPSWPKLGRLGQAGGHPPWRSGDVQIRTCDPFAAPRAEYGSVARYASEGGKKTGKPFVRPPGALSITRCGCGGIDRCSQTSEWRPFVAKGTPNRQEVRCRRRLQRENPLDRVCRVS